MTASSEDLDVSNLANAKIFFAPALLGETLKRDEIPVLSEKPWNERLKSTNVIYRFLDYNVVVVCIRNANDLSEISSGRFEIETENMFDRR